MRKFKALSFAGALLSVAMMSDAHAQNPRDLMQIFGGMVQSQILRQADTEWRSLSEERRECLKNALREQGLKPGQLIQQGIGPSDPRIAEQRELCEKLQGKADGNQPEAQPSIYQVEGLAVGARLKFDNSVYRQYDCAPSQEFPAFTWCSRQVPDKEKRGPFMAQFSILHSRDGVVAYVNRHQSPAHFDNGEIESALERMSKRYGNATRKVEIKDRRNISRSVLVTWGNIVLQPLEPAEINQLANNRSIRGEIFVDLIGDFSRSAKESLPVYKIRGGAGFVWIATETKDKKHSLRFFAANASMYETDDRPIEKPVVAEKTPSAIPETPRPIPVSIPQSAVSDERVALVIGNSNYQYTNVLTNPASDANLIASSFRSLGFKVVTSKLNQTREELNSTLIEFSKTADKADWAVVYYAGHGIEFNGTNHLIPIDAQLKSERDIALETIDLNKVIMSTEGARKLRLIILDACRDNPFSNKMKRTTASRSIGRGLASIEPETGTLIVYAAKHGETALDGDGENSPFANALTKRLHIPNVEIRRLFDNVRDDVMQVTNKKQQPFSYGSLSGSQDFYFSVKE